jgi:hypothetical protein
LDIEIHLRRNRYHGIHLEFIVLHCGHIFTEYAVDALPENTDANLIPTVLCDEFHQGCLG